MVNIIVHAYADAKEAVVEVLYASSNPSNITTKMAELSKQYAKDYLAIYELPLDVDLTTLFHYPSVAITPEDFEGESQ